MSQEIIVISTHELENLVQKSVRKAMREELKNFSQVPEVMREKQAAEYLNIAPNTLRQYRSQGIGPAYSKTGTVIYYKKSDLDLYLEKSKVKVYE